MFFNDMPKKAVAYCRVSSEHQSKDETIQNQIEFAQNYCKLNGIELTEIYQDDGVTGILPLEERPAGQQMLYDAKKGKFNLVLVFKLDRLGRATRVILNAVHDLDSYGVKIRSMTEPFDTSDASGRFLMTILAGVADLERNNIIQRMELGQTRAAKQGKYLGGLPPYGYKVNEDGYFEPNYAKLPNLNMSEVDVIHRLYDMCLKGVSTNVMAEKLNTLGIPSGYHIRDIGNRKIHKNTRWRGGTIYCMLTSTTYKGIHKYGKNRKNAIERKIPALVDEETWERAQKQLSMNKIIIKGSGVKRKYLLRGLVKCEHCGHSYSGAFTDQYEYYTDIGRSNWKAHNRDEPCIGKTINRKWFDDVVWESCLEYIRNPQLVVKSIRKEISQSEQIAQEAALIRSRINENTASRQRLVELYKNGLIGLEAVSDEFAKVDKQREKLTKELEHLESKLSDADLMRQVDTATNMLDLLRQKVDTPDVSFEVKRMVVETMIDKITVNSKYDDRRARITIHFRFGDKKPKNYTKVKGKGRTTKISNTSASGSTLAKVLEVKKSFFAALPYQACQRKKRVCKKK
jgi:site-specific DNA recombinase